MTPPGFEALGTVRATLSDDGATEEALNLLRKRFPASNRRPILLINPERRAGSQAWHTDGFFTSCLTIARLCRQAPLTEFLTPYGLWTPELHVLYATPRTAVHRAPVSSTRRVVVRIFVDAIPAPADDTYTKPTWLIPGEEP